MALGRNAALHQLMVSLDKRNLSYVAIMIYQGTTTTCVVILLDDGDTQAGLCQAGCCCHSANTGT